MKRITGLLLIIMFIFIGFAEAATITLRWDANTEDDLAGYKLYYKADVPGSPYEGTGSDWGPSPVEIPLSILSDPDDPEFTIANLDAQYVYFLVLTAYDDALNESGYSNEVSTFYISIPQGGFIANYNSHTTFPVSGRAAANLVVEVYSGDTFIGRTTAEADGSWSQSVDFTPVSEGTVILSARTVTSSENEIISNTVTGWLDTVGPAPPSIPQGLSALAISQSQVNLDWEASPPNEGVTGYLVYRGDDIFSTTDTYYNDTGLTPSTTYYYEVAAYSTINNPSGRSGIVSATTADNPPPPPEPDPLPDPPELDPPNDQPPSNGRGSGSGCFISSTDSDKELFIKSSVLYLAITAILSGIVVGFIFLKQTIEWSFKKSKNHIVQTDAK